MSERPRRRIVDDADVLPDPGAHWPYRPDWRCVADGLDWPCVPLRRHLLATMSTQDIAVEMGGRYLFAVRELDAPPVEVHRRFLGWIRDER